MVSRIPLQPRTPRTPRKPRGSDAPWVLAAVVVAVVIAWLPAVSWLGFPFRMLTTLVHELGHGLAALLTGGDLVRFIIHPDGSGVAYTVGGARVVVIAAGYLGAAAFASFLIALGATRVGCRLAVGGLGAALALLTLRYGLPSLFAEALGPALLTLVWGLALGGALVLLALFASMRWIVFTVWLTAVQVGLGALSDLWVLVGISTDPAQTLTDAQSMAALTLLPALVWAVLWALTALAMMGGTAYLTWGGLVTKRRVA